MTFSNILRGAGVALGMSLATACAADLPEGEEALDGSEQAFVDSSNGLKTINGLKTFNGLITTNGLTTSNGLKTINGFKTINGLRTFNGFRTYNGLEVDCTGKTLGTSCTGSPDGLLSATKGLMKTADGVTTASYLMRCALAGGDSIKVKSYTGALVTLSGEIGLAPSWKDGQCDKTCQERVSACLMAFTNGDGLHVDIEMSAPFITGGNGHSTAYPYVEAAFFGNVFLATPQAYYCTGHDYVQFGNEVTLLETRACKGYNQRDGSCPYRNVGYCDVPYQVGGLFKCYMGSTTGDTAQSCNDDNTTYTGVGYTWYNPITTFRKVLQ